jgi:hypothetical protein
MVVRSRKIGSVLLFSSVGAVGCVTAPSGILHERQLSKTLGNSTTDVDRVTRQIDANMPEVFRDVSPAVSPLSEAELGSAENYEDLRLDEVLGMGLGSSSVLRDAGGAVLRSPESMSTSVSRQLAQMDPRYGTEAALSAFDAQLAATANFNKNDRIYNNSFFAGGANSFLQDYHDYELELSKLSAAGSLMALRGVSNYDNNNAPANSFRSSWNSWLEGELRQPLLQGGGLEFNRIAGPGGMPGVYNGILIAKVNGDMTDADFQLALRDYVSNVENAYWDLYLAWRDYDAKNRCYAEIRNLYETKYGKQIAETRSNPEELNRGDFDAANAAYVRQQMLQMRNEVREALYGRLLNGTEVRNGSSGGTIQASGGVLTAERRLRLLIGLPATDGRIIRPADEPTRAEFRFDWEMASAEALAVRPEVQKQNLAVKKRELELLAAKNFLNPRLDAVGRYRFRGFGDSLIGGGNQSGSAPASALGNLAVGDQQEWAVGIEMTLPLGFRKAHAAVSHAELNLMRERSVQREQQREVLSNLTGAWGEKDRAYESMKTAFEQWLATREYVDSLNSRAEEVQDDRKIDGWRKLSQAESLLFRARAEYAVSLKNIHYEKGSLLEYKNMRVHTAEETQSVPDAPSPDSVELAPSPESQQGEPALREPPQTDSDTREPDEEASKPGAGVDGMPSEGAQEEEVPKKAAGSTAVRSGLPRRAGRASLHVRLPQTSDQGRGKTSVIPEKPARAGHAALDSSAPEAESAADGAAAGEVVSGSTIGRASL